MTTTYGTLRTLMSESGLSFEQFGERLGVSGMTLRRWDRRSAKTLLPTLYARAVRDLAYELVKDGVITPDSERVMSILRACGSPPVEAGLAYLGFTSELWEARSDDADAGEHLISQLGHIGANRESQAEVLASEERVASQKGLGHYWLARVQALFAFVKSGSVAPLEKLVAIGCLIYLIEPFDSIPDFIPGAGLLDDVGIISVVIAYYGLRFPHLFKDLKPSS